MSLLPEDNPLLNLNRNFTCNDLQLRSMIRELHERHSADLNSIEQIFSGMHQPHYSSKRGVPFSPENIFDIACTVLTKMDIDEQRMSFFMRELFAALNDHLGAFYGEILLIKAG